MSFRWSAGLYRIEIRKPLERSRLQQRLHGGGMKFLLTSAGIKNTSIHDALVDLLGKPIAESGIRRQAEERQDDPDDDEGGARADGTDNPGSDDRAERGRS